VAHKQREQTMKVFSKAFSEELLEKLNVM